MSLSLYLDKSILCVDSFVTANRNTENYPTGCFKFFISQEITCCRRVRSQLAVGFVHRSALQHLVYCVITIIWCAATWYKTRCAFKGEGYVDECHRNEGPCGELFRVRIVYPSSVQVSCCRIAVNVDLVDFPYPSDSLTDM